MMGTRGKKVLVVLAGVLFFGAFGYFLMPYGAGIFFGSPEKVMAGGILCFRQGPSDGLLSVISQDRDDLRERFQRPSKELPYPNPYTFKDFQKEGEKPPLITTPFSSPEKVILAYYGILQEASNMLGYSGGCGTIGWSKLPYPYAYQLLTEKKRQTMSLDRFVDSFEGIGYTTLLKLIPAYEGPQTPAGIKYYMVELEVITGEKAVSQEDYGQGSRFAYYYGLAAVEETPGEGWKISDIYYIPEDFLCAPMHSWFYLSDAVVQIVYGDNLKIIDQIDQIQQEGDQIQIYASGKEGRYRFDFVRLTNGYDILLHEYMLRNGIWEEVNLLPADWAYMKLTIENNQLRQAV